MITLGIEEEVFVTEPLLPTTRSLWYLAKFMWQNPARNYSLTASNFARGNDLKFGMMSAVEIATDICVSPEHAVSELRRLRQELLKVTEGYVVACGHLLQIDTPTNVAALQVHVGGTEDIERAYDNLAHFMPLLMLLCANSPMRNLERWGQSYRCAVGYATGALTGDRHIRFQDIIISKRLGTIELRALDPVPCTSRIRFLLDCVVAICRLKNHFPLNLEQYARIRSNVIKNGLDEDTEQLWKELSQMTDLPHELFTITQADATWNIYQKKGLEGAYKHLDRLYRGCDYTPPARSAFTKKFLQPAGGFLGYYLPKFPYITYKWLKEK